MTQSGHRLFARLYDPMMRQIETTALGERRARLLGNLAGEVLEVGAGTGANLAHYPSQAAVTLTEPDEAMRAQLHKKIARSGTDVVVHDAAAEDLPYPAASFDAVVFTLVLCTVVDPDRALAEAWRVLRPHGSLIAIEHVRGSGGLARWQRIVDPLWTRLQAGCHVHRDTAAAVTRAGFITDRRHPFRVMPTAIPASPMIEIVARRPG